MAAATLSPSPKEYFFNIVTGAPLAGGFVYTVTAGGSVPGSNIATYQDSNATITNSNPIQLNAAGYATIYLQPGKTYKFIVTDANGVMQWTQDGIEAIPSSSLGQDVTWTAGDTFAIGQAGYLSDGSGGKTAGVAYLADSANTYSSTTPIIALATAAITSGSTGVFRQGGIVPGLSGLTAGAKYYVGTAGALTAVAPTNARVVGVADNTTTQLDVSATLIAGITVSQGGTGATTLTLNNVLLGNGTSALQVVAPGTSGNLLTSDGTTWNSTAPSNVVTVARVTTQFDKTTSTSYGDVTGLSLTLAASGVYLIDVALYVNADTSGGYKSNLQGTMTATAFVAQNLSTNNTGTPTTPVLKTSFPVADGIAAAGATTSTLYWTVTVTVNAGGTIKVQFAQSASNGTSSVLVGSYLRAMKIA